MATQVLNFQKLEVCAFTKMKKQRLNYHLK